MTCAHCWHAAGLTTNSPLRGRRATADGPARTLERCCHCGKERLRPHATPTHGPYHPASDTLRRAAGRAD